MQSSIFCSVSPSFFQPDWWWFFPHPHYTHNCSELTEAASRWENENTFLSTTTAVVANNAGVSGNSVYSQPFLHRPHPTSSLSCTEPVQMHRCNVCAGVPQLLGSPPLPSFSLPRLSYSTVQQKNGGEDLLRAKGGGEWSIWCINCIHYSGMVCFPPLMFVCIALISWGRVCAHLVLVVGWNFGLHELPCLKPVAPIFMSPC